MSWVTTETRFLATANYSVDYHVCMAYVLQSIDIYVHVTVLKFGMSKDNKHTYLKSQKVVYTISQN